MKRRTAMPAAPRMGAAVIMVAPPVAVAEPEAVAGLAADVPELARLAATELAEALVPDAADEAAEVTAPDSELYTVEKPVVVA